MFRHARDLEIAACPRQSSRNQGAGHHRTPRRRTGVARDVNHPNAFLSEGGALAVVVESLPVASRAIEASSWEREKGAAGVMEGPGESSPRSGFEGAGAPRQPQCITLGRLAPRHYAVRRRPRCARLARRGGRGTREAQPRFASPQRTRDIRVVPLLMRRYGEALYHNGGGSAL